MIFLLLKRNPLVSSPILLKMLPDSCTLHMGLLCPLVQWGFLLHLGAAPDKFTTLRFVSLRSSWDRPGASLQECPVMSRLSIQTQGSCLPRRKTC